MKTAKGLIAINDINTIVCTNCHCHFDRSLIGRRLPDFNIYLLKDFLKNRLFDIKVAATVCPNCGIVVEYGNPKEV